MLVLVFSQSQARSQIMGSFMKDSAVVWEDIFPDIREMENPHDQTYGIKPLTLLQLQ